MPQQTTFTNARILDGTGAPAVTGNVVMDGDRIAAAGPGVAAAGEVIDLHGLAIAPGFIDMHSHCDLSCMSDPQLPPKIRQGVTLEVLGQDGLSEAPIPAEYIPMWRKHLTGINGNPDLPWDWVTFADYLQACSGAAVNVVALVGHGPLRLNALGMENRAPTQAELDRMCQVLDESLAGGAVGWSTGLIYSPCVYSDTEEMIAFGRVVRKHGGFMVYHMRYEGGRILEGMEEVFRIQRESGAASHISHFKARGRGAWGQVPQMIAAVDQARAEGLDVTADQYPYMAGSTMLSALLPPWVNQNGADGVKVFISDPAMRDTIRSEVIAGRPDWESTVDAVGWERITISGVQGDANRPLIGLSLAEIGTRWGIDPYDAVVRLLLEEDLAVSKIIHHLREEDVRMLMQQPWTMTGSDGLMGGEPHPRTYGTFARKLGTYVRDEGLESLEEAIRKMTGLSAWRLGLPDRGVIAPGMAADLVVFDPATIADRATYQTPRVHPDGIHHVIVNGVWAVRDNRETGNFAGRSLRRQVAAPGYQPRGA